MIVLLLTQRFGFIYTHGWLLEWQCLICISLYFVSSSVLWRAVLALWLAWLSGFKEAQACWGCQVGKTHIFSPRDTGCILSSMCPHTPPDSHLSQIWFSYLSVVENEKKIQSGNPSFWPVHCVLTIMNDIQHKILDYFLKSQKMTKAGSVMSSLG